MRYFRLIQSNIDPKPFLDEIEAHPDAWMINTSRQDNIEVQRQTNTIFLRSQVRRPDLNVNENQESNFTEIAKQFPRAIAFMAAVAHSQRAQLSRATIVRLKPHSQVYRHIDAGSYYLIRDRYHFVLRSAQGSLLTSGDEQVRMKTGELWWFNNKQYHEAYNESDDWRIHYIFDLLPPIYGHLAVNAMFPPEKIKVFDIRT